MGRAKVYLAVLFNTMAANLVEVARWEMRESGLISLDAAREKKVRTPRRHTKARRAAKALCDEARRLRFAKALLEENGLLIDYQTGEILESGDPPNR
jgi:hypothetical protein